MAHLRYILIVDDNEVNRKILTRILVGEYQVLEAENGREALDLLAEHHAEIAGIILDIVMPVMDGFEFMTEFSNHEEYHNIPIVTSTGNGSRENELKSLALGAWDFVSKPYDARILKFRLKNAIDRSQLTALKQLKYLAEYDTLTGIYNKSMFYRCTEEMLKAHPDHSYVLIRFDIDRFQLVNSFYGREAGDSLIIYLANVLKKLLFHENDALFNTFGRMEADIFAFCFWYEDKQEVWDMVEFIRREIKTYNRTFDLVPVFGIYFVEDRFLAIDRMLDLATLAAKKCKGNYMETLGIYDPEMSKRLEQEQEIINEMSPALDHGEFCVFMQPKYSLETNMPCGAEALVRWKHPEKGMISPNIFVPIFEKNGFISKVDYFMWESVCRLLRKWIDEGLRPWPVSVNVSRVNLYNPHFVDMIYELLERYRVPTRLLQLELTESAYMDNPQMMKQVVRDLHSHGLVVLMDDFGSGYSSLSILKDIEVDVLKIDMRFLEDSEIIGRGENIIASIVRMAKWLNMPAVVEGVEKIQQVDFLRSIGCEFVQGYYYNKPLPLEEYEEIMRKNLSAENFALPDAININSIWNSNPQMEVLFTNATQASCIYEYNDGHIARLRVNKAYFEIFGFSQIMDDGEMMKEVGAEYQQIVAGTFDRCIQSQGFEECEYQRMSDSGRIIWINLKLKYITQIGVRHLMFGTLFNVTAQKTVEDELKHYQISKDKDTDNDYKLTNRMLVIDDTELERELLDAIFSDQYEVLKAENGKEAIEIMEKYGGKIDIILLDVMMPVMDGIEFLGIKKKKEAFADIPVIMITADETPQQQIQTLSLGANDYILKPFVPEIVRKRVHNVLESTRKMREILKNYQSAVEQAETDSLTQLYNRIAAEKKIQSVLMMQAGRMHAMIMLDLDSFKQINDQYGHQMGDQTLIDVSAFLSRFFRKGDVIARFGGDEFGIFMVNIPSVEMAYDKCQELCRQIDNLRIGSPPISVTCSAGLAVATSEAYTFERLYRNADQALYITKCKGKNNVTLYREDMNSK